MPYRCLATEVFTREKVVQRSGLLADAVRNSMAYPWPSGPSVTSTGATSSTGPCWITFRPT
ncbi:MAG: hypothetical protein WKG07_28590 [Hymenobacter sp.]